MGAKAGRPEKRDFSLEVGLEEEGAGLREEGLDLREEELPPPRAGTLNATFEATFVVTVEEG